MDLEFIYPALPTCLVAYLRKSDFHWSTYFYVVIVVKKWKLLCLAQVVFSYFVLHSSKIPLVVTTKVTHLCSLLFRQPDGIDCVVRRIYFGGCAKTSISAFMTKSRSRLEIWARSRRLRSRLHHWMPEQWTRLLRNVSIIFANKL